MLCVPEIAALARRDEAVRGAEGPHTVSQVLQLRIPTRLGRPDAL